MMRFPRLHKRPENGVYYYRVVVPPKLIPIIGKREIKISLKTTNEREAMKAFMATSYEVEQQLLLAKSGKIIMSPKVIKPKRPKSITLDELMRRYFTAQEQRSLSPKTVMEYEIRFNVMRKIFGKDRPIAKITRQDCRNLQQIVMKLPPNASKRFPNKSIAQVIAIADEHGLRVYDLKPLPLHYTSSL
jgi:hypothetical protein